MVLDEAFKLSARDEVLQPDIRKTGIHPNFWYPVARSDNVKTGKPHGVSFAGEPIVLVRTECCSCPDFVDNKNSLSLDASSVTYLSNQERRSGWQLKSVSLRSPNSKDPTNVPSLGVISR